MGSDAFEFADADKDRFRSLAASVSFVGVCTMMLGLVSVVFLVGALYVGAAPVAAGTGALAALCVVTAWWMMSAGRSLSALVRTRGRDVEDLMEAVTQFRRLFGLASVVVVVVAVAAVVGFTLAVDRGWK